MAFFQLVVKAHRLKYRRVRYQEEKLASIQLSRGVKVKLSLWQRARRKKLELKRKARDCLSSLSCWPEESLLGRLYRALKSPGTLENYILTSLLGFLFGVLLTYLFFLFFVFQLRFGVIAATIACSVLGLLLSLGLAFSGRVRCLVFLFLPQFFTKRGRQAMMAYAFILTLTGPAKNTLYNIGVLSESLACGQQLLKETVQAVIDLIKQPFLALRDSLSKTVKSIKAVVRRIKQTLVALKRLVLSILRIIKSVFEWLGSIVRICNKKFGTPYERCNRIFENAEADCRSKLGSVLEHLCNLTYLPRTVCVALKPLDLVCSLVSYVSDSIVGVVHAKLKTFAREMKLIFYVKIKFSHSFHFETNKSQSIGQIASNISGEIKDKTRHFFSLIDWVSLLTSLFFLVLCLRVIYYRYKWLSSDRFDNRYISSLMREIDAKRARLDKETIFPLNRREREKYTSLGSLFLIQSERRRLGRTVVFLATSSCKLAVYMLVDYCLYWLLDTISRHGQRMRRAKQPSFAGQVRVQGRGFLAEVYRSLARSFTPRIRDSEIEGVPCLPVPKRPDYDAYAQIGVLVLFCWLVALFEPYGLRLRHTVLNYYYPERARQRAVWLYNRILRSRGSFLKFARRQLRRRFGIGDGGAVEKVSLRERLWAVFPILGRIWPVKERATCLLCGEPERDKSAPHVRCPTPGCVGTYCAHCFRDLRRMCTVCMSPLDYGDLSDFSEERDSSDDQVDLTHLKKQQLDKHSYSYQDDESEISPFPLRTKFKDVEAQTICDDVTMQIFDLSMSESSDSDQRISCFGIVAKREQLRDTDSTSIANTESWPTEEVSNDQAPMSIESLNSEEENRQEEDAAQLASEEEKYSDDELLFDRDSERKKSRKTGFKSILPNIRKIFPFIRKKKKKKNKDINLKCMNKCRCSSTIDRDGESQQLRHRGGSDGSKKVSKRNLSCSCRDSSSSKPKSRRRSNQRSTYEQKLEPFRTQEIPKHLRRVCSDTKYYEINESSSSWYSPRDAFEGRFDPSELSDSSECSADSNPSRDRCSASINESHDSSCTFTSGTTNQSGCDAQSQSTNPSLYDVIMETSDDTSVSENVVEPRKISRPSIEESSSESESSTNSSVSSETPRKTSKPNIIRDESSNADVNSILDCPIIVSSGQLGSIMMDLTDISDQVNTAMDRPSTSNNFYSQPELTGSSSSNGMRIQLKDRIREDSD
ncbi:DC-STAMP domain-containing protein 2-like [Trichogramma pretiosum]|uniref:DC-STAMP domain-containing protein 2-like n=1 Tax=Trichogramma pretiosum TaxID=7493 RepID=UPI0006C992CC|nr:DC-STAMP domain-containing protein 2-like [Trichogramma pretiosum]